MKKLILLVALVALVACRSDSSASSAGQQLAPHDSFSHFAGQSTFVFQPGGTETPEMARVQPRLLRETSRRSVAAR